MLSEFVETLIIPAAKSSSERAVNRLGQSIVTYLRSPHRLVLLRTCAVFHQSVTSCLLCEVKHFDNLLQHGSVWRKLHAALGELEVDDGALLRQRVQSGEPTLPTSTCLKVCRRENRPSQRQAPSRMRRAPALDVVVVVPRGTPHNRRRPAALCGLFPAQRSSLRAPSPGGRQVPPGSPGDNG